MIEEFFERVKLITGAKTQEELALILGIRQSSISDAKRRNSIPSRWLVKLLEQYGASPEWLRTGSGVQFLAPADNAEALMQKLLENRISVLPQSSKAALVAARAAVLLGRVLGMAAENMHRYATQGGVSYGEEAFDRVVETSGCLEEDVFRLMGGMNNPHTEPGHGGHARGETTEAPQEATTEGCLQH